MMLTTSIMSATVSSRNIERGSFGFNAKGYGCCCDGFSDIDFQQERASTMTTKNILCITVSDRTTEGGRCSCVASGLYRIPHTPRCCADCAATLWSGQPACLDLFLVSIPWSF